MTFCNFNFNSKNICQILFLQLMCKISILTFCNFNCNPDIFVKHCGCLATSFNPLMRGEISFQLTAIVWGKKVKRAYWQINGHKQKVSPGYFFLPLNSLNSYNSCFTFDFFATEQKYQQSSNIRILVLVGRNQY